MSLTLVFESIILAFCASSLLVSLITLVLIFIRIRPLISNVPILLTCNTYITLIGSSLMTLLVMAYAMYGNLHPSMSFDNYHCQIRSYFNYVFVCAFYYSCALQAIFRLCRVVFPQHIRLQSRYIFIIAIIIQWLISIIYVLNHLFLGDLQYQSDTGICWISFKNIRALSIAMAFVYGSPLIVMSLIYVCIIRYIRQPVQTQQIRQNANKRDKLVVKRMLVLILIAMAIGIPTGVLLIIYIISSYLTSLAYHIQALSLTSGLVVESIVLGMITPQVREIFKINRQESNPIMTDEIGPQDLPTIRALIN
jgi:hypothetical protein